MTLDLSLNFILKTFGRINLFEEIIQKSKSTAETSLTSNDDYFTRFLKNTFSVWSTKFSKVSPFGAHHGGPSGLF